MPYGTGAVTAFTGLSSAAEGARTHGVGARWNMASGAVIGLEGVHVRGNGGEPGTSSVMLRTEMRW